VRLPGPESRVLAVVATGLLFVVMLVVVTGLGWVVGALIRAVA
jgi:hypothetical protein